MRIFERFGGVIGLAFFFCYSFAFLLLVVFQLTCTDAGDAKVVDVHGNVVDVAPYTEAELRGQKIYHREVCWHCHSQFVRPVNEEDRRFGPVSQPGESAIDRPHLFGTRRIGPDLAREGGLRSDDWQLAHLWNPRVTVSASVMPGFSWLFQPNRNAAEVEALLAAYDYDGDGVITAVDSDILNRPSEASVADRLSGADTRGLTASVYRQKDTGADLKLGADGKREYVDAFTQIQDASGRADERGDGLVSDLDGAPVPTGEARDLLAYLQRLGTAIGPWRRPLAAPTPQRQIESGEQPMKGVTVTWKDSAGAEQSSSIEDGLVPRRERKRRLHGEARSKAQADVLAAAKDHELEYAALMGAWRKANPYWDQRLIKGEALFVEHCVSCHGAEGRGNGVSAKFLPVRPRDFTQKAYRYRSTQAGNLPLHGDLYRTLWRGLPGTAMPPWRQLGDANLWLLVEYVEHFLETIDGERDKEWDDQSAALAIPPVPKVTAEQVEALVRRGKAVFAAGKCSNCHGTEGRADGPGWETNMDNGGKMRARDLKPRFPGDQPALRMRGGAYPQDLYRTFFTGLGGTAMASSLLDFHAGWAEGAKLDALVAAGAPAAEIEAQTKAARRALIVPLHDDDLVASHGVVRDEQGSEHLDRLRATSKGQVGDDWALVFYVLDLMGERALIPLAK